MFCIVVSWWLTFGRFGVFFWCVFWQENSFGVFYRLFLRCFGGVFFVCCFGILGKFCEVFFLKMMQWLTFLCLGHVAGGS